jgi:hypothetical protein
VKLALKRLKVYVRGAIVAAVLGAIALVLLKNRNNRVAFWFFGLTDESKQVNVVWLVLSTASSTLLVWRILWAARGWWRDWRELRKLARLEEVERARRRREAEWAERERQVAARLRTPGAPNIEGEPPKATPPDDNINAAPRG